MVPLYVDIKFNKIVPKGLQRTDICPGRILGWKLCRNKLSFAELSLAFTILSSRATPKLRPFIVPTWLRNGTKALVRHFTFLINQRSRGLFASRLTPTFFPCITNFHWKSKILRSSVFSSLCISPRVYRMRKTVDIFSVENLKNFKINSGHFSSRIYQKRDISWNEGDEGIVVRTWFINC